MAPLALSRELWSLAPCGTLADPFCFSMLAFASHGLRAAPSSICIAAHSQCFGPVGIPFVVSCRFSPLKTNGGGPPGSLHFLDWL